MDLAMILYLFHQGHKKTFGEFNPQEKLKIDHRSKAFLKISNLFIN